MLFVGVDVGSHSARAMLISDTGDVLGVAKKDIKVFNQGNWYEHSSQDIWNQVCQAVRQVVGDRAHDVAGIGFTGTCSLVVLDKDEKPVPVNGSKSSEEWSRNVIMWADHRAASIAMRINGLGHPVLRFVGNKVSAEMEIPKILWLKENLRASYDRAAHFIELPDFLTFMATGKPYRSFCSLACKFNYHEGFDREYLAQVGLDDLLENDCARIGGNFIQCPGEPIPGGLSDKASEQLGLPPGITVATSIIDAHCGALGLLGSRECASFKWNERMAVIGGTSNCLITVSESEVFVDGVWGPYKNAVLPDMFCNEGGQSAAGQLIDYLIQTHPARDELLQMCETEGIDKYTWLANRLAQLKTDRGLTSVDFLTCELHMTPDFNGNRSPFGLAAMTGVISGLDFHGHTLDGLAIQYLAAIQSLAYSTRMIILELNKTKAYEIKSLSMCGGLTQNDLFASQHANILQIPILIPKTNHEAVLTGACILAATANTKDSNKATRSKLEENMKRLSSDTEKVDPHVDDRLIDFHQAKFDIFCSLTNLNREQVSKMALYSNNC